MAADVRAGTAGRMNTVLDVHLRVTFDDQDHAEILIQFDNLTPAPIVPDIRFDIDGSAVRRPQDEHRNHVPQTLAQRR